MASSLGVSCRRMSGIEAKGVMNKIETCNKSQSGDTTMYQGTVEPYECQISRATNNVRQSAGQSGVSCLLRQTMQQATHWLPAAYLQFSKSILIPHQKQCTSAEIGAILKITHNLLDIIRERISGTIVRGADDCRAPDKGK